MVFFFFKFEKKKFFFKFENPAPVEAPATIDATEVKQCF